MVIFVALFIVITTVLFGAFGQRIQEFLWENILGRLFILRRIVRQFSRNYNVGRRIIGNIEAGEDMEASTPSSITSTGSEFEVFLSFRGTDTRKGFIGHLYEGLQLRGVSTFKDDVNLDKRKEIGRLLEYIEKSKIFVPIFSENYADSEWCLKEVTKSVECGKEIVPVFFGVEPSDVRNQRGSFETAFKKHQSNNAQDQEEVKKWREALLIVGYRPGFTLKEKNGDETELKLAIIQRVLDKVNRKPLNVARYPIGIKSRVEDIKRMLKNIGGEGVRVIGICGMGGLGKTTIAKAVYNELAEGFSGATCFLSDVRENARQHNGLVALQKQVFHQIFKDENIYSSDVAHGASLIKARAHKKRVLLILDDVDSKTQMDALAGERDWFGSGSVIIITTRNERILLAYNVKKHEMYEPAVLDEDQSKELFMKHAFNGEEPKEDYLQLSKEVVASAAGLPLTLEVLGSFITCDMDVQEWKYLLEKLKKIPPKQVLQKLKLSYDRLDIVEQLIFLDISCYFIGQRREYATYMWEGCGWFPTYTIKVLEERSLIKIDEKSGEFWMHDQIRDMGRAIVKEKSSGKVERQSRVWNSEDSLNMLQIKGTAQIEAIDLFSKETDPVLVDAESFAEMPYLRMLCLRNNVRLEGKYEHIPKALRWLEWHPEDLDSLPDSLHLENIVVLDLSDSSITQLWNSPQRYTRIKVLCLSYCRNLSICPDFGGMPMLEKLDLKYCDKITQLDPSIRQLKDLRHLSLRNCHSLKELPEGFWQSTSLEMLDLTECYQITNLPHQWKDSKLFNLGRLEVLKFIRCENLTMCPDFTSMPHLNTLEFDGCRKMTELHPSIGHLGSLTLLSLRSCHSLKELPEEFWQLTSLEKLDLTDCVQITTFPSNLGSSVSLNPFTLGNLKVLYLSWCESLTICPDFTSMPHLETLFFDGCQNMSELHPSIGCLKNLVQLSLRECESLQELPQEVCQLTSLQKLDLNYCTQIATLTMSSSSKKVPERILSLPNLEEISDCDCSASSPNSLGNLKNLRQLDLSGTAIEELPDSVMSLDKLEVLLVAGCDRLKFLPASASTGSILRSHEKPSASTVGGYSERQQHSGFPQFPPSLITLDATGCYELEMIADVSKAKGLQKLDLRGCKKLADVPGIEQLKMLKSLKLGGCRSVSNSLGKGFKSKQSTLD